MEKKEKVNFTTDANTEYLALSGQVLTFELLTLKTLTFPCFLFNFMLCVSDVGHEEMINYYKEKYLFSDD